ncbi:MAG: ABC transporter ATP-binding protein [Candidatus Firestonebacteria bacterium]
MLIIETRNLSKVYISDNFWSKRKVIALKNINLKIKQNQVYGLLGLNGAGKTTLMKVLLGLIFPTKGEAFILGKMVGDLETKRNISYLPEMPYFPRYLTPIEILDFYGKLYELEYKKRKEKVNFALELVKLNNKKNVKLKEFSKGMLQRVGIAQLLINDAKLFFLDEPTYGLDPLATKEMRNIILMLKKSGKTIFLSSHQINEVKQICDKIGILHNGSIIDEVEVPDIKGSLENYFVKKVSCGEKPI